MALLIRAILLALVLVVAGLPALRAAGALQLYEQEIKAGLLYNFLKYTDWPQDKMVAGSLVVCIFGDDPFQGDLQPMAGRSVNQHVIAVRTIHAIKDAADCHLLFVNEAEKARWPELMRSLAGKAVLTVSDFDGFAASGGMIEFGHKNDHISAQINMAAVTAANLQVQDRLLKLVTVMPSDAPAGR